MVMDKVLPGSSRAALTFVTEHWQGLVKVSIVPMLIITAIAWYQIQGMGVMFEFIAVQTQQGDKMDAATMSKFFESMSKFYGIGMISILAFVWLFVRIVRFWKSGAGSSFGLSEGELGATFMTIVYGVGMMFLTMGVYIAGAIAFVLVGAIIGGIGAALGAGAPLAVIGSILLIAALFAGMFGLIIFMYRFLVGLPGVALGEVPGFFSDIWPLAKGESFGLPSRIFLWTIVGIIPIMILAFMFSFPLMADIQEQLKGQTPPQVTPEMMNQVFKTMAPLQVVNMILQMPLIWFATVLLTEAHFRFRKKLSG
jgi:hypothetical protein